MTQQPGMRRWRCLPRRWLLAVIVPLLLTGCGVTPTPMEDDVLASIVASDRERIEGMRPPVEPAMDLPTAVARALKHNLDHRILLLETAEADSVLRAGRYDLLPDLISSAGYSRRDEETIRNSIDSVTGEPSLSNPSISSERTRSNWQLGLTWHVLDFGAGYFTAKQNADRVLIAEERQRRASHALIEDVRFAFWKAVAAQRLDEAVATTIASAEEALANSEGILQGQLQNPQEALRYQRNLLENVRLLENVQRELSSARIELTNLLGLDPDTPLTLEAADGLPVRWLDVSLEDMEAQALMNNPDLRMEVYNARIAAAETRKALLGLLPGLSFDYNLNRDNDRYLINNQWQEAGIRVGFNLFNLLAAPARLRQADDQMALAEFRRLALQMVVLTQLHLAYHEFGHALKDYRRAVQITRVDQRLSEIALERERGRVAGELDRISADVSFILSAMREYRALARVHEQVSRVQAVIGQDPAIGDLDAMSINTLAVRLEPHLDEWPLP